MNTKPNTENSENTDKSLRGQTASVLVYDELAFVEDDQVQLKFDATTQHWTMTLPQSKNPFFKEQT